MKKTMKNETGVLFNDTTEKKIDYWGTLQYNDKEYQLTGWNRETTSTKIDNLISLTCFESSIDFADRKIEKKKDIKVNEIVNNVGALFVSENSIAGYVVIDNQKVNFDAIMKVGKESNKPYLYLVVKKTYKPVDQDTKKSFFSNTENLPI